MLPQAKPIREIDGSAPGVLTDALLTSLEPVVLRGLVAHWPFVAAARTSFHAASSYLRRHYRDASVIAMLGGPDIGGRFFYNEDLSGFNFAPLKVKLDAVLGELHGHYDNPAPPAIYVGSTTVDTCLPGFRFENDVGLGGRDALASIWIGNRTRIAAHYDLPDNLACVAAGRRRFTLFPPEQLPNLYIGPLDFTPAGQSISLVDFHAPDLARFPRFAQAMEHAQVAELDAGDALFIPSMWWHHIEALDAFNVLVNYWWRQSPEYMDTPINALMHALMSIRDMPLEQRRAWHGLFRHYVFEADEDTAAHIPAPARRILAPLDDDTTRLLRAQLLKRMNR
ncbi:cupin-like domain-containing protein [Massilia sp. Dwa41.01b]|uniref:cupin-like domain-containing protein n=1 Tax=unclassified Massilia TaxID=2609279 RepID=UPI0016024D15|nr:MULTISPECIES: cupin-like domain-containing protein [unclassified Massilia]QNA88272.1 cupin-like domain-containing protein [Massilia sp. Dwa41.01b]QNA99174.1 cupin-like domain-containing protein [Massilia sp. Se16.2.3]